MAAYSRLNRWPLSGRRLACSNVRLWVISKFWFRVVRPADEEDGQSAPIVNERCRFGAIWSDNYSVVHCRRVRSDTRHFSPVVVDQHRRRATRLAGRSTRVRQRSMQAPATHRITTTPPRSWRGFCVSPLPAISMEDAGRNDVLGFHAGGLPCIAVDCSTAA